MSNEAHKLVGEQWMVHYPISVSSCLFQALWAQQGGCAINHPRAWTAVKLCAAVVDMTPRGLNGSLSASADSSGAAQWSAKTVKTLWMCILANHINAQIG